MRKKLPFVLLKTIAVLSAVAGLAVCVFALPSFGLILAEDYPAFAFWRYPVLAGLYAAAACFFFALVHFWLLLTGIARDGAFPKRHLKAIRCAAVVFAALYALFAMPVVYGAADADDAPGLILVGAFLDTIPIGIAAMAAILERGAGNARG